MRSPYKAKTLSGAQKRVRELMVLHAKTTALLEEFARDRIDFAKLACKQPLFDNPLVVWEIEARRDNLLRSKGLIK